jgi:O-acetyl-ADP-ribose deacetylase (regulator of RNase III)
MITYVDFSLFDSPAKVLVNTVNTVGVMGKGIAKEFKSIYPEMFTEYQQLCERGMLDVGHLWVYKTPHKWVLNFPTKKHWRSPSKTGYLEAGLRKFAQVYQEAKITSISFPQLGCGNGELDWKTESKPLMEKYLKGLPIEIFIHVSSSRAGFKPEHKVPKATKEWLRTQPESLAFTEVWDDLVRVIISKKQFATLDGNETFEAVVFDDAEGGGIKIVDAENPLRFHKEQLIDLWQQVRELGICIPQIMPSCLDFHTEYIVGLLAELEYFEPIRQASRDTKLTKNAVGLLLKPSQSTHYAVSRNVSSVETESRQLQLV